VHSWTARNRAWTAAILAFVGTTSILYLGSKKLRAKRRKARRAANGGRKEIIGRRSSAFPVSRWLTIDIVVAGSPHEPMTRSIAADLDRRGYIVYITVSSAEEEQLVRSEHRPDIRPLWLDLSTVSVAYHKLVTMLTISLPILAVFVAARCALIIK
jgi:hypothetical protein